MTSIVKARQLARADATALGHHVTRMRRSPYRRGWVGWCRVCGRVLLVEPVDGGEWSITGNASRMKCATAARTFGAAALARRRVRQKTGPPQ